MLKSTNAPPCRFFFFRILELHLPDESGEEKVRKVRRRGKELVYNPYIIATNDRHEFGLTQVERPQPFRAATSDLGIASCRCNLDFKYMPRGFVDVDNVEEIFRCDVSQLAACSRILTLKMLEHTAVKRMALSMVALHVAANIVDYYITKYVAKPMEQLQNLITQYALGLRRLEDEEAADRRLEDEEAADQQTSKTDPKVRAKRVMLRLQMAANRSSWISSTEAALFVHCGEGHFITHQEVPVFLSRVWYLMHECQRVLQGSHGTVLTAATVSITTIDYACTRVQSSKRIGNERHAHEPSATTESPRTSEVNGIGSTAMSTRDDVHLAGSAAALMPTGTKPKPPSLQNLGNTCYLNAISQCFRQVIRQATWHDATSSSPCPFAEALRAETASMQWRCWRYFPPGRQRDASEVLEDCMDPTHIMHNGCRQDTCYARWLRACSRLTLRLTTTCCSCEHVHVDVRDDIVLHVPAVNSVEESLQLFFAETNIETYTCAECGGCGAQQMTTLDTAPEALIVHVKKVPGQPQDVACSPRLRLNDFDYVRISAVHHHGNTPSSGHYTATVDTENSSYHCNDHIVQPLTLPIESPWDNCYLSFFLRTDCKKQAPRDGSDPHHPAEPTSTVGSAPQPAAKARTQEPSKNTSVPELAETVGQAVAKASGQKGSGEDTNAVSPQPGDSSSAAMALEQTEVADNDDHSLDSGRDTDGSDEESDGQDCAASDLGSHAAEEIECQPCAVRTTTSRHDDWLHRGVQLAALPFIVYIARVKKVSRPAHSETDRKYIFPFDAHYPSHVLYCQKVSEYMAIPRLVGSVCPPPELNDGEDHAAYKLMLFSTARCPGKGACSDPLMFRPLLQRATKDTSCHRFAPAWRTTT